MTAPAPGRGAPVEGLLLLDKPEGLTSHDVVARARRALGERRIGHTGTLDPLASGVLVLVLGRATRLASFLTRQDKSYEGSAALGQATDTYDRCGRALGPARPAEGIGAEALEQAAAALRGPLMQVPPPFSARKVGGERLYRSARRGEKVEAPATPVTVSRFDVERQEGGFRFTAEVSSGTYIRSLVHDLGESLGCGAHMTALRRTRVGPFDLAATVPLATLVEDPAATLSGPAHIPLDAVALPLPILVPSPDGILALAHGRAFAAEPQARPTDTLPSLLAPPSTADEGLWQVRDSGGRLLALAGGPEGGPYHPRTVLITPETLPEYGFTPRAAGGSLTGLKKESREI